MAESEKHQEKRTAASVALHIVCILAACALFQIFLVLSLQLVRHDWKSVYYALALSGGTVLNASVLALDLTFYFLRKEVIYKFCITAYILGVFFAVSAYVLLRTGFFDIMQDEEQLKAYLRGSGKFMYPLFVLLQFLQVVVLPIPSTVTVVAGAALFGPLVGSLLSLLGIVLGSLVAFLVGRYAGYRVVAWLVGKDTLDKWLKKIKGKDKLLLTAMFLLPVFPDDVLCFVAGISSMSLVYFLVVIVISRVFAIFTTSYSISLIPFNTWWGLMIWGILFALVIVLFIVLYKKSDAILSWFERKFHRETRVKEKTEKGEFTVTIIDPDGSIVEKGVSRGSPPKDAEK